MSNSPTFRVALPLDGPLSREAFFAPRSIRGLDAYKRLGFGTAGLGGVWGPVDESASIAALHDAWGRGFLLADTSPDYADGRSEEVLGRALRSWGGPRPTVLTKLEGTRGFAPPADAADWPDSFERQRTTSERRFAGHGIDALAMHDAERAPAEFEGACAAYLRECLAAGRVRAVGIGGGGPAVQLRGLAQHDARGGGLFTYLLTFKRLGALSLQALTDVVPDARRRGASVVVGSPTFMGLLSPRYEAQRRSPPYPVAPVFLERAARAKRLADAAGLPLAHLALRFALSVPGVDFVLTGAARPEEWADAAAAHDAGPLPADLYAEVWANAQGGEEPLTGG